MATTASFYIARFIAGDVNGDAKTDLVAWGWWGNPAAGRAQIFLGSGNGRFVAGQTLSVTMQWDAITDIADVNRDGALDLLVPSRTSALATLQVWLGDGRGRFSNGPPIVLSRWFSTSDAAVADLNHDGYPDVVSTGSRDGEWGSAIVLGGASGFGQPVYVPHFDVNFELADINLDGHVDIIGSGGLGPGAGIWQGHGDGTFAAPEWFDHGSPRWSSRISRRTACSTSCSRWSDSADRRSGERAERRQCASGRRRRSGPFGQLRESVLGRVHRA